MLVGVASGGHGVAAADLPSEARAALERAVGFFTKRVATQGGYLWRYSADLSQREGEGQATATQIWVQPPGTPAVGEALLGAYRATGDERYLSAAVAAAEALIWGQLACGGWDYKIDFDPIESRRWYRRRDLLAGLKREQDQRYRGTMDDDTTQSATRFVIEVALVTGQPRHREAAEYALDYLLEAQFDNGAWPQWYPLAEEGYSRFYTFNDGAINDCIATMLKAWHAFGDERYLRSAAKGGEFIIASQLDEPQSGWAQQYDWDMKPAWARKFEPPAVCSKVTSRNIRTLVDLYLQTGVEEFLAPIPAAIQWLEASAIGPDRWARFYELGTNRPLYFTRDYQLVYTAEDLPTHYSFQGSYGVSASIRFYHEVLEKGREAYLAERDAPMTEETKQRIRAGMEERVAGIVAALDEQGRWIDADGWISCQTFIRNVGQLSAYLALCGK